MGDTAQPQLETIHWRDTASKGGHTFNLKPRAQMLLPGGLTIFRKFKQPGRAWGRDKNVEFFNVIYDEDYVTEWLLHNVVGCFPGITHVEMREVFTKALKLRKQIEDKEK